MSGCCNTLFRLLALTHIQNLSSDWGAVGKLSWLDLESLILTDADLWGRGRFVFANIWTISKFREGEGESIGSDLTLDPDLRCWFIQFNNPSTPRSISLFPSLVSHKESGERPKTSNSNTCQRHNWVRKHGYYTSPHSLMFFFIIISKTSNVDLLTADKCVLILHHAFKEKLCTFKIVYVLCRWPSNARKKTERAQFELLDDQ